MARNYYTLRLGSIDLSIFTTLSVDSNTSAMSFAFHVGAKNSEGVLKRMRQAYCIPKDDLESITCVEDIEKLVTKEDKVKVYEYEDDDGEPKLFEVDPDVIKTQIYPKSDDMSIIAFIDRSSISIRSYNGHHYFMGLGRRGGKAARSITPDEVDIYSLLYYGLSETRSLLVSFIYRNTEKYGVLYADNGVICMSLLNYEQHLRKVPSNIEVNEDVKDESNELFDVLIENVKKQDEISLNMLRNHLADKMKEYVNAITSGKTWDVKKSAPVKNSGSLMSTLRSRLKKSN